MSQADCNFTTFKNYGSKPWLFLCDQTHITEEIARNLYYELVPQDLSGVTNEGLFKITANLLKVARRLH